MSAAGSPKKSSPSFRRVGELEEVAVCCELAGDGGLEPVALNSLDDVDDAFDVVFGIRAHAERQNGAVAVLRREVGRAEVVLDVVRHAKRLDLAPQLSHLGLERGRVDLEPWGVDDHELVDVVLVGRDARRDQLVGLLRLGCARHLALGGQRGRQQQGDDADRDDDRQCPDTNGSARPPGRRHRKRLDPSSHACSLACGRRRCKDRQVSIW